MNILPFILYFTVHSVPCRSVPDVRKNAAGYDAFCPQLQRSISWTADSKEGCLKGGKDWKPTTLLCHAILVQGASITGSTGESCRKLQGRIWLLWSDNVLGRSCNQAAFLWKHSQLHEIKSYEHSGTQCWLESHKIVLYFWKASLTISFPRGYSKSFELFFFLYRLCSSMITWYVILSILYPFRELTRSEYIVCTFLICACSTNPDSISIKPANKRKDVSNVLKSFSPTLLETCANE